MECDLATSTPDWVIDHPILMRLFQELGIDFSCGGKSLEYACLEKNLDPTGIFDRLKELIKAETADRGSVKPP